MNYISDALQVWDSVKDSVKAIALKSKVNRSVDCSFITPNLLALGQFNEENVDELLAVLQGNSMMMWNLSGKQLPQACKLKLQNHILEYPWITPGPFTQAPTLSCLFSLCYSVKSWLDLSSDHVAVIHCGNGRSRTGILIACLLKYMKAFDQTSFAFDFFCGARMETNTKPTLAPSYRILFDNIDKTVDNNGQADPNPVHLKSISLTGLPVDEVPCVEVWDMNGIIYASHGSWNNENQCTWSAEYGDGLFNVGENITGDFSITCRFGGQHMSTRDKTTLIFKYQNNTVFLPRDIVRLNCGSVDINPEYADSLDVEIFAMDLLFEKSPLNQDDKIKGKSVPSFSYHGLGKGAFEAGLDELSKHRDVIPDPDKSSALVGKGFSEEYVPIALQLTNNSVDAASDLILKIKSRVSELNDVQLAGESSDSSSIISGGLNSLDPISRSDSNSTLINVGFDVKRFDIDSKRSLDAKTHLSAQVTDDNFSLLAEVSSRESVQYNQFQSGSDIYSETPTAFVEASTICGICNDDNDYKKDQLIPCSQCKFAYHTTCFGGRRIPFTLQERHKWDKYTSNYFGKWKCRICVNSPPPLFSSAEMKTPTNNRTLLNDDVDVIGDTNTQSELIVDSRSRHIKSSPLSPAAKLKENIKLTCKY